MEVLKKDPEKITIELTLEQATLLLAGTSSAMINLEAFQKTMTIIFGDNNGEKTTTSMVQEFYKIGFIIKGCLDSFHSKNSPELFSDLKKV